MKKNWYCGFVNIGLLRVPHSLCSLIFERNFFSVIFVRRVMQLTNMAFAPWRVRLENNTGDVMARQAEGLV